LAAAQSIHANMEKSDQSFMCDVISADVPHPQNSLRIIGGEDQLGPIP